MGRQLKKYTIREKHSSNNDSIPLALQDKNFTEQQISKQIRSVPANMCHARIIHKTEWIRF